DFPPPRQVKKDVPPALEAVCLQAMALKPEDRYPTALDLAADVEHWLADEPVSAYRERAGARLAPWGRQPPRLGGAARGGRGGAGRAGGSSGRRGRRGRRRWGSATGPSGRGPGRGRRWTP